jgi:hypothetical protein
LVINVCLSVPQNLEYYFHHFLPAQDSNRQDLALYVSVGDHLNSVVLKADYYQHTQVVENMAALPGADMAAAEVAEQVLAKVLDHMA